MTTLEQDLDSPQTISIHRRLILKKPFLRRIYLDFYSMFVDFSRDLNMLSGELLEIGSGGGFLKDIIPEVITSDIAASDGIERVFSADQLPFEDHSLKAIYLLNVLHHLDQPDAFLNEVDRCLVPHGRLIMIEPYNSLWARFFYKYLHHEPFDENMEHWQLPKQGRLSTSNQAMPWIIFWRDRDQFNARFPRLCIKVRKPHTAIAYVLSGGLSMPSVLPAFCYPLIQKIDHLLSRFPNTFPLFQTLVIEKLP